MNVATNRIVSGYSPVHSRDFSVHEHARLMARPYTADHTIMCDLFETSCRLKSHVQSFAHSHRTCYEQKLPMRSPRLQRSIVLCFSNLSVLYNRRPLVATCSWPLRDCGVIFILEIKCPQCKFPYLPSWSPFGKSAHTYICLSILGNQ